MEIVLERLYQAKAGHLAREGTPFVCATWAQSTDGYIANVPGSRTAISCNETNDMTHEIRAAHDSILVGINTVLADNPRLTARLTRSSESPRPVVLDSNLRTPSTSKFLHQEHKKQPIILCAQESWDNPANVDHLACLSKFAEVRPVKNPGSYEGAGICFNAVLKELSCCQVQSVMVEGGGTILNSVVSGFQCDYLIVTVAPRFFGRGVLALSDAPPSYSMNSGETISLVEPHWQPVGSDIVLSGVPSTKRSRHRTAHQSDS